MYYHNLHALHQIAGEPLQSGDVLFQIDPICQSDIKACDIKSKKSYVSVTTLVTCSSYTVDSV